MNVKKILSLVLAMVMIFAVAAPAFAAPTQSVDEFLAETGMPLEEICNLDSDIKDFIIQDLQKSADLNELEYVETVEVPMPMPMNNEVLTGISFTVSSWKSGNTIYIYPTYEYTTPKKQKAKDGFAFQLGDAMRPYEFGGQTWTKLNASDSYSVYKNMVANNQQLNGAEYTGSQLGNSPFDIYVKGCAYCHATVGSGSDKRICMSYMNNPNGKSYSVSYSAGGFGVSFSSEGTIYTASKILTLSY